MSIIKLPVKAKHFRNAIYIFPQCCPISQAAQEFFNDKYAEEAVDRLSVNGKKYLHDVYSCEQFYKDLDRARTMDDDAVVRTIILNPLQ
jgi:hypothetical protein